MQSSSNGQPDAAGAAPPPPTPAAKRAMFWVALLYFSEGLPMGVQLIGRPGGERTLLALGAQLERRIAWQRRHPAAWEG